MSVVSEEDGENREEGGYYNNWRWSTIL